MRTYFRHGSAIKKREPTKYISFYLFYGFRLWIHSVTLIAWNTDEFDVVQSLQPLS